MGISPLFQVAALGATAFGIANLVNVFDGPKPEHGHRCQM